MSSTPPPMAPWRSPGPDSLEPPTPPEPDGRRPDEPPWPVWTAVAGVGIGFVLGIVVTILVDIVAVAGGSSVSNPSPAVVLISDFLFDLSFVAAAVYFAARFHGHAVDFGYRRIRPQVFVGGVLLAGVGYYILSAVYASLAHLHGKDKLPSELGVSKSTAALIGATVFVCVVAPIAEELFFRGFLFGALRRMRIVIGGHEVGTWVAAAITGILFGLAHTGSASPQYLVPLGLFGFILCLLRWRTRSLYPGMALHSINNSLALGVSQLSWNGSEILALMAGSLLVIAVVTGPLSARAPATA